MRPVVIVTRGRGPATAYVKALRDAGAEPMEVAYGGGIPAFDALCLSGGPDVDPRRYGQEPNGSEEPDRDRDRLELDELLPGAWQNGRPVLAICRGIQVLNVFRHGTLVQDIGESHRARGDDVKPHPVRLAPASRLAAACGPALIVNSRHHQVIGELGDGVRAVGWADGYVEAVEAPDGPWVVGVQWHPERTAEVDPAAVRIFEAFVRAAERVPAR